jgi:hypothetical protein
LVALAVDGTHSVAHFPAKKLARQSKFKNFVNALILKNLVARFGCSK